MLDTNHLLKVNKLTSINTHNANTIKINKKPKKNSKNNDVTKITIEREDGEDLKITAFGNNDTEVLSE